MLVEKVQFFCQEACLSAKTRCRRYYEFRQHAVKSVKFLKLTFVCVSYKFNTSRLFLSAEDWNWPICSSNKLIFITSFAAAAHTCASFLKHESRAKTIVCFAYNSVMCSTLDATQVDSTTLQRAFLTNFEYVKHRARSKSMQHYHPCFYTREGRPNRYCEKDKSWTLVLISDTTPSSRPLSSNFLFSSAARRRLSNY